MILHLDGLGTMQQVMGTIVTTEGARSALNNPGNLIYVGQAGASPSQYSFVGKDGRTYYYAQFDTPDDGQTALQNQISLDAQRGMTIQQFTNSYAPAGGSGNTNNPTAYAQYIANATGLSVNDPLSSAISAAPPNTDQSLLTDTGAGIPVDTSGLTINPDDSVSMDTGIASTLDPTTFVVVGLGVLALAYFAFALR